MATEIAEVQAAAESDAQAFDWVTKPQAEHEWLHTLVGEWSYSSVAYCAEGEEPMKTTGTMSVRSLGGLWIQGEGIGEMPGGGEMTSIITLGYDPKQEKYVGTWLGSMMGKLWVYDATREGDRLILASEGPSFTDESKTALYQDIVEIVSKDHHTLTARVQNEDGSWWEMMKADYHRKS